MYEIENAGHKSEFEGKNANVNVGRFGNCYPNLKCKSSRFHGC